MKTCLWHYEAKKAVLPMVDKAENSGPSQMRGLCNMTVMLDEYHSRTSGKTYRALLISVDERRHGRVPVAERCAPVTRRLSLERVKRKKSVPPRGMAVHMQLVSALNERGWLRSSSRWESESGGLLFHAAWADVDVAHAGKRRQPTSTTARRLHPFLYSFRWSQSWHAAIF